jgi:hypothetical protein
VNRETATDLRPQRIVIVVYSLWVNAVLKDQKTTKFVEITVRNLSAEHHSKITPSKIRREPHFAPVLLQFFGFMPTLRFTCHSSRLHRLKWGRLHDEAKQPNDLD